MRDDSTHLDCRPVAALLALVAFAGCVIVPASIDPNAFGASKRYAIVTTASLEEIGAGTKTLREVLKGKNPARDAQELLNALTPSIYAALDKSEHFDLVPERYVLRHEAYKAAEPDEARMMMVGFYTADGYKFFKDKHKLGALARELGVDGVLVVGANFGLTRHANSVFADITFGVNAYDQRGQVVWRDTVFSRSDETIGVERGAVAVHDVVPLLTQATDRAAIAMVTKLDEKLASGTSGFHMDPERHR